MALTAKAQVTQIEYHAGALEEIAREQLGVSEGTALEVRVEDGRMIVELLRPKILAPVSDVGARQERTRQIAEATEHAMKKHHELLALLAK